LDTSGYIDKRLTINAQNMQALISDITDASLSDNSKDQVATNNYVIMYGKKLVSDLLGSGPDSIETAGKFATKAEIATKVEAPFVAGEIATAVAGYADKPFVAAAIAEQNSPVIVNAIEKIRVVEATPAKKYMLDCKEANIFVMEPANIGEHVLEIVNIPDSSSLLDNQGLSAFIELRVKAIAGFSLKFPSDTWFTNNSPPYLFDKKWTHLGIDISVVKKTGIVTTAYTVRLLPDRMDGASPNSVSGTI